MADRIVVLNAGEIEQIGSPLELYNRPANRFVAGFLGSPRMNFIHARVTSVDGRTATIAADGADGTLAIACDRPGETLPREGDAVVVGLRPEAWSADPGTGWPVSGRVAIVENLGRETLVYADLAPLTAWDSESHEGYFAIHRTSQMAARHGDPITASIQAGAVFLFAEDGTTLRGARTRHD